MRGMISTPLLVLIFLCGSNAEQISDGTENETVQSKAIPQYAPKISNASEINRYKILLSPLMMKSHVDDVAAVAVELSRRGHHVHFLVGQSFPVPGRIKKHNRDNPRNEVRLEFYQRPALDEELNFDAIIQKMFNYYLEDKRDMFSILEEIQRMTSTECERLTLHNEPLFEKFAGLKFDAVVIDTLPIVRCLLLLPHRLGVPWIAMTDLLEPAVVRLPYLPSFVPAFMTQFTDEMNFADRVRNTAIAIVQNLYVFPEPSDVILDKYRQYGDFKNLKELAAKTLFWITSRDSILDYVKPGMPNVVDAGGLTVGPATDKLAADIIAFIKKGKKGIIIVSFGSGAFVLPRVIKDKLIAAFELVEDYNFLWRVSADENERLPSNVMRFDWLPQNDLLARDETKAFITHCGNNGQFEALYHAVPMIGFPLSGDQPYNAKRVVKKGYGLQLDVHEFAPQQLVDAIHAVVNDNGYKERISKASRIYRGAADRPAERAAFWIEHVTEFGADHLRGNSGLKMSIFEYYCVDVFALFGVVIFIAIYIVYAILRCVVCRCVAPASKTKKD